MIGMVRSDPVTMENEPEDVVKKNEVVEMWLGWSSKKYVGLTERILPLTQCNMGDKFRDSRKLYFTFFFF